MPRFRCHLSGLDTSSAVRLRSPSRSPPDAITCAFSSSLTTTVFSQRSMRWFDASPRRATPKGHQSFIFCTAPQSATCYPSAASCVRGTPQLPRVPSLILSSFATLAIGRDVSITIFTASSLNSGEKLFLGRGNYFTFPDGPSYWMDCPEASGHLTGSHVRVPAGAHRGRHWRSG